MTTIAAPRIPAGLLDEIERHSRRRLPIAEINRRVGRAAWRMSLPRPSYERVRVLVHIARRLRRLGPRVCLTRTYEVSFGVRIGIGFGHRFGECRRLRLRDRASP